MTSADTFSSKEYAAQDGTPGNIGEPFILMLTINVRDVDTQPDFRNRTIDSITVQEDTAIPTTPLPAVVSGNAPITYSVSALPAGMTMGFAAADRELTGTPTTPGIYQITYTAKDQDGDTASLTFTITVEADTDPVAPSIGNMIFTVGQVIALTLPEGSGGNGALTYELVGEEVDGLGLVFVQRTRYLSGTVPELADGVNSLSFTLSYTVMEMGEVEPDSDMTTFTITVNAAE